MNLEERIKVLKRERNAVILAHNYVPGEVQDIADFVGDSLELSVKAAEAGKGSPGRHRPTIVFCGVSFMAETAKILSPDSTVLLPVPSAGCPMADMADAEAVRAWKTARRDAIAPPVLVAYVNSTAAVKAEVDICCTSANAEKIVRSIPADKKILFLPDRNLGANVMNATGREMELWPGFCPTHNRILPEMALAAKERNPGALLLVHPECLPATVAVADYSLSTGGMLRFVKESSATHFIIGTEYGILHRLRRDNPGKTFIPLDPVPTCPNMKKITLESVVDALENMRYEVTLAPEVISAARAPIERMLCVM